MKEMKPNGLIRVMMASLLTLGISTSIIYYNKVLDKKNIVYTDELYNPAVYTEELVSVDLISNEEEQKQEEITVEEPTEPERIEVYYNLTIEELSDKLNRVLSSDLSGKGESFAKYSIDLGVDPYLAVAIAMHETGCTWNCSHITKSCNNVGGQKGDGCGAYKAYDTLEEGIYGFISNIKVNYVDYGLTTAETMNPKYAEDTEWSSKVNKYIEKIKNS